MTAPLPAGETPRHAQTARPIRSEHLITFEEARELFPDGKRPSVGTILSWVIHGRRGIKLETTKVNGKKRTSIEALRRFRDLTGLAICLFADSMDDLGMLTGA